MAAGKNIIAWMSLRIMATSIFQLLAMLSPSAAQAMSIQQFDRMADQDQVDYIVELIHGAEKVLRDSGQPDLTAQVEHLFTTKQAGNEDTPGMALFEASLATLRAADARNVEKKPAAQRLEVEHAMILALKQEGIVLPKSFMTVAKNFKPRFPPEKKEK